MKSAAETAETAAPPEKPRPKGWPKDAPWPLPRPRLDADEAWREDAKRFEPKPFQVWVRSATGPGLTFHSGYGTEREANEALQWLRKNVKDSTFELRRSS